MNALTAQSTASAAWDEAAQGWSRHGELIRGWLNQATEAMLDAACVKAGDRVLDVAAGAGDQTLDIARRVGPSGSVLATDLSPGILRLAAENLRAAGVLNVRVQRADAQALGPDLVNFDAAVCRLGLMFCAEPLLALKGIHGTLVHGGRFCALVFSIPETNPCITTQLRTAHRFAGVAAGDPFTPGGLLSLGGPGLMSALMHEAGFTAVEVRTLSAPFVVPHCEDYVDFIRSAGSPVIALLKPLPAAAREAAWADIARQLDRFTTPQGWVGPNELLLCAGIKTVRPQESP